jgi:hypothetical protein
MFSNNGLGPNCIVIFAVESTEKTFVEMNLTSRAFYHSQCASARMVCHEAAFSLSIRQ